MSDLETVRAKAMELGVPYHPAQKAETIQNNIDEFLEANAPHIIATPKSAAELEAESLADAMSLIPVTVTSMDPSDATLPSISISVGNRKIGQITKVIPFGHKWYMPKILVKEMEQKQFVRNAMIQTPNGNERLNTQWIKKYAIQYHPIPTPAELADLAKLQLQGNELAK
jgi:hypothetical protein